MNSFARSGDPTGPGRGVKTMPGYLRALASTGGHRLDGPRKVKG